MLTASSAGAIPGLSWLQLYCVDAPLGSSVSLLSTDLPVASTPGRLELPRPDFVAEVVGPRIRLLDTGIVSVLLLSRGW